ncbi:putative proteasome subunit alpha type 4 [Monocercomonoides exilis]|uniref:putative proteasome subunit alpha type 4 n=1 Tax=Monocercomonoides exilis TaxID=2049356 RepID=UPI00355AC122|nr:putative proteasome subunit alpha type 4 [Monocercomonoides exilis]|eukprot:MONOS_16827.1-p1 / transcript=MONOS_16827.1 / gene=MONOS_16827 / organism=Monocercomonoides_exilis_PA203 / gene_product=proteasome subunit alpha type 4 / transcript_product=proteasome subunit alpha type 4 / location=Mono_scaffold00201:20924-21947(-) / protein_length=261 / sequence_SO=supercontig / SO=protein_coding / is_pseudo=false
MSRRYDHRTTTFSPEGRLFQTEYAMEAINHSGAAVGILVRDGIVLLGVQHTTNQLLEPSEEKMFKINEKTACAVAGLNSDAINLIDYARRVSLQHMMKFDESMPLEQLISIVCDLKQSYTQLGGLRPYGVSFIIGGWDEHYGFQLYLTQPSGMYGAWKATAIGMNSKTSQVCLRQDYKETMSIEEATVLGLKAIAKSLDTANVTAEKLEIVQITRDAHRRKEEQIIQKVLTKDEITALIEANKDVIVRRDEDEEEEGGEY